MDPVSPAEAKFTKSLENRGTENEGLVFLQRDPRIQVVTTEIKRLILEELELEGNFGPQTFDGVMTPEPAMPITVESISEHAADLVLLEMKTTKKAIKNELLNGFFFGATEREYELAIVLGDRYRFAFVVLNSSNEYGQPFAVLLPLREVARRTRAKRIQYQVNFRNDMAGFTDLRRGTLLLPPTPEGLGA